ncbi:MAG: WD40 repeat domain-containing protein [Bdellovibrio sp.]
MKKWFMHFSSHYLKVVFVYCSLFISIANANDPNIWRADDVSKFALSSNNKYFFAQHTAGDSSGTDVYDLSTFGRLFKIKDERVDKNYWGAAFTPDSKYVVKAYDNVAKFYDLATFEEAFSIKANANAEMFSWSTDPNIYFSFDSKYLVLSSVSDKSTVFEIHDVSNQKVILLPHTEGGRQMGAFCPSDSKYIATIINKNKVEVFDLSDLKKEGVVFFAQLDDQEVYYNEEVIKVIFSPDCKHLAFYISVNVMIEGGQNHEPIYLNIFNLETKEKLFSEWHDYYSEIPARRHELVASEFSNNGRYFLSASKDGSNYVFDFISRESYLFDGLWEKNNWVKSKINAAAFSRDGKYLAFANNDIVKFFDITTKEVFFAIKKKGTKDLDFSFDGKNFLLASGKSLESDHKVELYEFNPQRKVFIKKKSFEMSRGFDYAKFSPNGKYILNKLNYNSYYRIIKLEP